MMPFSWAASRPSAIWRQTSTADAYALLIGVCLSGGKDRIGTLAPGPVRSYVECYPQGVYRPRSAQNTALYYLVEDHFDELERVWEERYEREHGFWRPVCRRVIEQFLNCGDLRCGFARLRCPACRKELLLPFSCRRRCFCPSCHQKRALRFAEHVDEEVLGDLPVRQYVVTIPKMLRLCFKYDRKLVGLLSQCFYASVKELSQDSAQEPRSLPGMIASLQSYGDHPTRFHPHLHSLVTDGLVSPQGSFVPVPCPDPIRIMERFRHKLVKALLAREKISPRLVEIMQNWRHPGFSVFQSERIDADDHEARRRLAAYLVHPPIALERLRYRPETGQVIYYGRQRGRCGNEEASPAHIFPALDFLAALCTHIPDTGQQLVRYYGAFSNVRRPRLQTPAAATDRPADPVPHNREDPGCADEFARRLRSSWARLIKKVYEADPLICSRCGAPLKIISLIDSASVIERILRHLKLWDRPERSPPPAPDRTVRYVPDIAGFEEVSRWSDATE
jgi:hypothetical protein